MARHSYPPEVSISRLLTVTGISIVILIVLLFAYRTYATHIIADVMVDFLRRVLTGIATGLR